MRTRRSPRNQERLWRELGGRPDPPAPVVDPIPRCWDCVCYPAGGRNRGRCTSRGVTINGRTANQPCFTRRKP